MRRFLVLGLLSALIAAACASPSSSAAPTIPPSGTLPATFPPGPPATMLEVWGTISGGRWIGGARYDAVLTGPGGLRAAGRLVEGEDDTLTPAGTLPRWLAPGEYTITFSARPISDAVAVGETPRLGPVVASCGATFAAADPAVAVRVDFAEQACTVTVADAPG